MKTTGTCKVGVSRTATVGAALLFLFVSAAYAHHSFAMFDMTKTLSMKGTVKELQWTNPHVWIEITVSEKKGPVDYAFEGAAIAVLKRVGWTKASVKVGDVVTVVGHPYKNGRPGGSIDHLILPDGHKLGTGDAIPGALRVPGVQ
ncbi:MAG: DUF6152 family protein [Gammaproteobacteria bacterium]